MMPSSWALIAAKDASIFGAFNRPDIGLGMRPKIGYPYMRLGGGEESRLLLMDRPRFL